MSATDQAFIRAYDPGLPPLAKSPQTARGAMAVSPAAGQMPTATLTQNSGRLQSTQPPAEHASSIHVGIEHFVPPPHAKFGSVSTLSVPATPEAPASRTLLTPPHLPFGQTAKAALSSFTNKLRSLSAGEALAKPALEVDAVRWPGLCDAIRSRIAAGLDALAGQVLAAAETGTQIVAVTGIERSEGRSTLTLCLARQLSATNKTVALVDADFSNPGLIQQLGVQVDRGWETVLRDEKALWDVMIESLADHLALAPLSPEVVSDGMPAVDRLASIFGELENHYDFVLVDAGPLRGDSTTSQWLLDPACGVQGVILTHDIRRQSASRVATVCLQLADAKQQQLGIAEMFTEEQAAGGRRQAAKSV
jgi:Mrp family chromosome partitioning ATPase